MQTVGSRPDSPSTAILAMLPMIESGHRGNLGLIGLDAAFPPKVIEGVPMLSL